VRIAGLGQDRGRTDRRQPGDAAHQLDQPQLLEHVDHPALDIRQLTGQAMMVAQHEPDAFRTLSRLRQRVR
jgi:hypothetical protein